MFDSQTDSVEILRSELKRREAVERTLTAVAEELLAIEGGDLRRHVSAVFDVLSRHIGCDRFLTIRFLDEVFHSVFLWTPGEDGEWYPDNGTAVQIRMDMLPAMVEQLRRGEPYLLSADGAYSPERSFFESFGEGSAAALPVFSMGRLRGALVAMSPEPLRSWETHELSLVTSVGRYIGQAFLNRDAMRDLNRSRAMFEHMAETSDNGVWLTDGAGRTVLVNDIAAEWLGLARSACPGRRADEFPSLDSEDAVRLLAHMVRGRQSSLRLRIVGGAERWVDVTVVPMWDESGAFDSALSLLVDVTDQVVAEREVRRSAQRDRLVAEARRCVDRARTSRSFARDICRVLVEYGGFNKAWVGMHDAKGGAIEPYESFGGQRGYLQYSTEQLRRDRAARDRLYRDLGRGVPSVVQDVSQFEHDHVARAANYGIGSMAMFPLRLRGGDVGFIAVAADQPFFFDDALIETIESIAADFVLVHETLTSRARVRHAERKQGELAHLLEAIVQSVSIGIMSVDEEGRVTAWNAFAERTTGMGASDVVGVPIPELFGTLSSQQACALVTHVLSGAHIEVLDVPASFRSGRRIWARITASPLRSSKGKVTGAVVFFGDHTAHRRLAQRTARQQQRLRESTAELGIALDRERRQIALGLHDTVGQNLAALSVVLGMMEKDLETPEARERFERATKLLRDTIRETRSFTFEISPPILDELGLGAALEWLVDRYRAEWPGEWRYEGGDVDMSLEEAAILYRSARELLGNAARHASASRISVALWRERSEVRLSVTDNGVGLSQDKDAGKYSLGLFGVREQLGRLGARLEMHSPPGLGTHAEVVLPVDSQTRTPGMDEQ